MIKPGQLVWLSHLRVRHVVVMFHDVRLLMTAVYADEYLVLQIKFAVGRLNQFESQLATTEVAARRWRRLGDCAHGISFRPTCFGSEGMGRSKGSQFKGWIENQNALR
jgi:hypothetical protein